MQWVFLVLAVLAALAELHTGTFYLAGVAAAAATTTLAGIWVQGDLLIVVFLLLCAIVTATVMLSRRTWIHGKALADFDIGERVTISSISQPGRSQPAQRVVVSYRGAEWQAVMDDGSIPVPGDIAIIRRKTDKLLHLGLSPEVART